MMQSSAARTIDLDSRRAQAVLDARALEVGRELTAREHRGVELCAARRSGFARDELHDAEGARGRQHRDRDDAAHPGAEHDLGAWEALVGGDVGDADRGQRLHHAAGQADPGREGQQPRDLRELACGVVGRPVVLPAQQAGALVEPPQRGQRRPEERATSHSAASAAAESPVAVDSACTSRWPRSGSEFATRPVWTCGRATSWRASRRFTPAPFGA